MNEENGDQDQENKEKNQNNGKNNNKGEIIKQRDLQLLSVLLQQAYLLQLTSCLRHKTIQKNHMWNLRTNRIFLERISFF